MRHSIVEREREERDNLEGENGEQNNCLNEILDVYTWKHDRTKPSDQKTSSSYIFSAL